MADPERPPRVADALADAASRLENAHFTVGFRGYEPREVHGLLREVAAALRSLADAEAGEGHLGHEGAEVRLDAARAEAAALIEAGRKEADGVVDAARRDADEVRRAAEAEARRTVLDAVRRAGTLLARAQDEAAGPTGDRPSPTVGSTSAAD